MTKITVIVESTFSGPASGFHAVKIDDSEPVVELIQNFCHVKEVSQNPNFALITQNNVILVDAKPISDFFIHDGQVLKLIKRRPGSSKFDFRQWMTLAGLGIFIAIVGFTASVLLYAVFGNVPDSYALIIAAESTQTDIKLNSWPGEKLHNTGQVMEIDSCSVYAFDAGSLIQAVEQNKLTDYFDTCFNQLYMSVVDDSKKYVEVIFGATEEIGFLNETDPKAVEKILDSVRSYLTNSDWEFKNIRNVDIINGAQQGISKWISANINDEKVSDLKSSVKDTLGILDLGDRSTQISFGVTENSDNSPDVYPITLFDAQYYVFSKSYTCYGVEEALRRYRAMLLIEHLASEEGSINITSPCEPLDWNFPGPTSYFSSPCVNFTVEDPPQGEKNWNFIGSGNYSECQRVVSKLLDYDDCTTANLGYCLDPTQIPVDRVAERNFYAVSAFTFIASSLGILPGSSLVEAERHVKVMCDYSMESLQETTSPSGIDKSLQRTFEQLCFDGQYMLTLLTQIYGFDNETKWSQISFSNEDKMGTIQWTLGFLINASQEISAVPWKPKLPLLSFSLLIIVFVFFLVFSFGFILHGFKIRKNLQGYQRKHVLLVDRELEKFIDPHIYGND